MKARSLAAHPTQWLQIVATTACAAALTVLLVVGMQRADELQAASVALKQASELTEQPQTIRTELTLIQRELESTAYLGDSLRTVAALRAGSDQSFQVIQNSLRSAGLGDNPDAAAALTSARSRWKSLDQELRQLDELGSNGLYVDTPSGSELSATGRRVKAAVDHALATQTRNMSAMSQALSQLGALVQANLDNSGHSLQAVLVGGSCVAILLLALMLYYAWRWRLSAMAATAAERQVTNILATVREGLFLVGRDLRIGEICSDSVRHLLRLESPAGRNFRDVLQPLVDEKTLAAAMKFLGLLWKEKVHEDLIESVNPLSQIEASFSNTRGGTEVRYLAFSFRRVRAVGASDDTVLGVVSDITDRVLLARELEQLRADSGSQATLLLQLLQVDRDQLQLFISSADAALRKSNAMLTAPGIEQQDLKNKLNGVFRELHALKGEAAALALSSLAQRIHAIEDMLQSLRARTSLSGNDFVPVVVKLDELINHMMQIQTLQQRVSTVRGSRPAPAGAPSTEVDAESDSHRITTVLGSSALLESEQEEDVAAEPKSRARDPLVEALRLLSQETAAALARVVRLHTTGLELVPPYYAAPIKAVCIQMLRNAIVHGIEPAEERRRLGKPAEGTVRISFTEDSGDTDTYRLTIEDDGHGLSYEHIIDKALRLGLINPSQAAALDRASAYRLIFLPGFSTIEEISEHAGRGVGLDAVSTLVREYGGRISVSTATGRYTRFRISLPRSASIAASSAA